MQWKTELLLCTILMSLLSCKENSNTSQNNFQLDSLEESKGMKENSTITSTDLSHIHLILRRGAFHWDSFELKGNELKYLPSKSEHLIDNPDYQKETSVKLSDSTAGSLSHELIRNSIFELDSLYAHPTTCNSLLEIELVLLHKSIKVRCVDYERGCPEILTNLEEKLIQLHGKGLKRIVLPG